MIFRLTGGLVVQTYTGRLNCITRDANSKNSCLLDKLSWSNSFVKTKWPDACQVRPYGLRLNLLTIKSNETVYIKLFNLDWESTILNHLESKYLDQQYKSFREWSSAKHGSLFSTSFQISVRSVIPIQSLPAKVWALLWRKSLKFVSISHSSGMRTLPWFQF